VCGRKESASSGSMKAKLRLMELPSSETIYAL
jgi:hypothetical protein